MRLRILLPKVNPEAIPVPIRCAYTGCEGRKFHLRQQVAKPLRVVTDKAPLLVVTCGAWGSVIARCAAFMTLGERPTPK